MADYYVDYDGNITTKKKKKKNKSTADYYVDNSGKVTKRSQSKTVDSDIAPVKETKKASQKSEDRTWFKKSKGGFWKTVGGTLGDIGENLTKGIAETPEKLADFGMMLGAAMNQQSMNQAAQSEMLYNAISGKKESASTTLKRYADAQEEVEKETAKFVAKDIIKTDKIDFGVEDYSVLGEKSDALVQSAGQLGVQIGVNALVPGSGMLLMGASAFGSEAESALNQGATFDEAMLSSTISAGAEMLTEKIGGVKFGGKTATDAIFGAMSSKMTNKLTKVLITSGKFTADALAEGGEEVLSGYLGAIGQKLTYMEDKEIEELFSNEDLLESFVGGVVLGGAFSGGEALISGRNAVDGMNKNERTVVEKVYNDAIAEAEKNGKKLTSKEKSEYYNNIVERMDKGDIDINTIEEVLGGEDYKAYKEIADLTDGMTNKFNELGSKQNPTLADQYEYSNLMNRLKENNAKKDSARAKLDETMSPFLKNSRLVESYNERARKGQAFEADLTQYSSKQRVAVERAIKSGVLNNTNKSHALVNTLAQLEADKGIIFDYTSTEKLKELGFALEGKTVNGFASKSTGAVTLNVNSAKSWQSVVGHEIGHILKGVDGFDSLQNTLYKYAKSKGELESRRAELTELYKNMDADIEEELTCDLIGDYLFTDKNFIKHLTGDISTFKKVYEEVKYLCKVATGKQLTEIEQVKQEFDKVWKDFNAKGAVETDGKVNLSVSRVDDITYVRTEKNTFLKEDGTLKTEREVFDTLVGKPIPLPDGEVEVVKYLPDKNMYNELYKRYPKSLGGIEDVKQLNSDVNYNMGELLSNSKMKTPNAPDKDNRHAKQGITNFDTRTVKFYDGEKAYDIEFSIAKLQNGKKVAYAKKFFGYDAELTKKIKTAESRSSQSPFNQRSFSEDIVPQNSNDVKTNFSLSKSVEETKNLVAVHNMRVSELEKSLALGGLPMPSIAIIKAQSGHSEYGDVSLVFDKNAIDPKKNKDNKVYGGDAWTPTYPTIEYKANEKVADGISNLYYDFAKEYGYDEAKPLYNAAQDLEDELNRYKGEAGLIEAYKDNVKLMNFYLQQSGKGKVEPIETEIRTEMSDTQVKMNEHFISELGIDVVADVMTPSGESPTTHRKQYWAEHGEEVKKAYGKYLSQEFGFSAEDVKNVLSNTNAFQIMKLVRDAYAYSKNGRVTTKTEVDTAATEEAIRQKAEDGYNDWIDSLFKGAEEKSGIRNNVDYFTPNGNRRSFEALHWENNLENVVRVMKAQDETGGGALISGFGIFGVSAKNYKSIDEIKADADRLTHIPEEEYKEIRKGFSQRLNEICESIMDKTERNQFIALDNACECVVDAIRTSKTKSGILNNLKQYQQLTVTNTTVDDIVDLVSDIANMPTEYFEAKPRRAVGFDEVATAIIPDNASAELKKTLAANGVKFVEYENGNEQSRLDVLNSLEEYKFSLSKQGEDIASVGNYNTPLNETAYAPVAENATSETVAENAMVEDIAPMPTDADAPPEMMTVYDSMPDTTAIDEKTLNNIGKSLRDTLSLTPTETKAIQEIVQEYSTSENPNMDELFDTIKEKFGEKVWKEKNQEFAEVKRFLRTSKINVSPKIKSGIADYKDFRKSLGSKLGTSKDGIPVDVAYQELVGLYPEYFSEDIWNETDQFLRMAEVASMDLYTHESYSLDDEVIQEAVNIIANEVRGYKENLTRTAAEDTAKEALDSVAPLRAEQLTDGSRADALLNQSLDNYPIKTVEDRLKEKIRAVNEELNDNKVLRREAMQNYDKQIADLIEQYLNLKNKNTKKANDIVRRISRLEDLKASNDANYAKRISDLEAKVEKMNTEEYRRAMNKQDKMTGYAEWAENLIGDTSTWVDKKMGIQYQTNTEHRNLRDIVRDANGNKDIARADEIYEATSGEYNRNHAEYNRTITKVKAPFVEMKINKAENAYIQMLGELRHNPDTTLTEKVVNEYYEQHKDKIDTAKVDKAIELARKTYDTALEQLNAKLREQGMKEIPYRQGYFPHFTEPKQNFIQKLLNWKTQDNEIPTSIAGLTEDFKPVKSWQSFDKTRYSDETDYNFLKGLDNYLQGAYDWVYHLEDIQKRRAIENYVRYTHSEEGIQAKIKEVYADETLDADEAQARIEQILIQAKNPLNNFVQDFMTKTNILAGKKNSLDRAVEQTTNRKIYSVMTNVQNRMSANMVLANVRSALTNFIPITQSWAQVSPLRSLQATKDTIANAIKDDGLINKSTYLTNRLRTAENLYQTNWDKIIDKAGIMFEIVDNFSSQVIWRSKYNQNLAKGMSESEAIANADQFAENVMAGRSKGNEPTLFNAKNPLVKAFTMFQLEVNNQYGYLLKDVPNDLKTETNHWKLNLAKGYTTAFIGAYVYNALLEQVAGSGAALDPIEIIEDLLKDLGLFDDDEEKEPTEVVTNLAENVVEELPFVGGLFGGGRIPINSVLPYKDEGLLGGLEAFAEDVSNIGDGGLKNIGKEMMNPILNIGLPVGGGQLKKTVQGLKMFNTDEDHPVAGSYTDSGALRFPVEDTLGNRIQAGIFGQWANENAREYLDNGYAPLKEKQIQEYVDVDLPIADYWKYREGLKGKSTLNEKGDYIGGLDLETWQKNLLINNIADREEKIDMTDYDDFGDFEEFDFAQKNPEKYAFLQSQGVTVKDYENFDEDTKSAYSWAANNPEKFTVSKAITGDVVKYKQYTKALNELKADKYANGKTVNGSRKAKVVDYLNNLDMDYYGKIILLKSEYPSDDTYNAEIINYLNNRNDLTYDELVTIYTELGFTVKNGYVYWD